MPSSFRLVRAALSCAAFTAFAACSSTPQPKFQQELFDAGTSPFSRTFNVGSADACEAARRALLNQGYLTTLTQPDRIDATKDFQPNGDSHISVDVHVVCTPGVDADGSSIMYANAIQSGYALKKSDTSASVGLSLLGSVSLPIRSNSDAMVKVSSETIQSTAFYNGFFDSVSHYVVTLIKTAPVPAGTVTSTTLSSPAPVLMPPIAPAAATPSATSLPAASSVPSPTPTSQAAPAAPAPTSIVTPAASVLAPVAPAAAAAVAVSASAPLSPPVTPPVSQGAKPANATPPDTSAPAAPQGASAPATPTQQ
ncbi:DUF2242 domain-containing protein [Trinickia dinghuensis]|uniref:DUF2242 domain-containing protein n=1 Tax=Trinickia dinghuensis TaxID=2291023 RepID=A0A3D8JTV0_9BURK|nr:DUF2242 domain-containing protein [Trinickia dinghuensis]RDU96145.1 DUF2242 domain-containing protein [Trinickia dinghuensis]